MTENNSLGQRIIKEVSVTYVKATKFMWEDDGNFYMGYLDKDFDDPDDFNLEEFIKKAIFVSMGYGGNVTFVLPKLMYDSSSTTKMEV